MTDLFSIAGKTALVTGGSRGIGRMIAGGFVEAGAKVYMSSRNAEVCDAVAAELSEVGECISVPADLSTESGCRALAEEMGRREDKLEVLVNNAGNTWGAPLEEFDEAAWERVLSLNVKGVFHTTKFLLPLLRAGRHRRRPGPGGEHRLHRRDPCARPGDVLVLGVEGRRAPADAPPGRKLAPRITVNAIAPGPFESKMMAATLDAFGEQIAAGAPMKRIGRPDDVAGRRHLPGLARRGLSDRRRPPRRRRHRHRRLAGRQPVLMTRPDNS